MATASMWSQATLETIEYSPGRELDKAVIRQLASCRWVADHQVVIITGATGVGKTHLACALANQACRKGHFLRARGPAGALRWEDVEGDWK